MSNYLIPTDEKFIEDIAKAIAKSRLVNETLGVYTALAILPPNFNLTESIEYIVDSMFDKLWVETTVDQLPTRDLYKDDARAAITAINLKLLTLP